MIKYLKKAILTKLEELFSFLEDPFDFEEDESDIIDQ